MTGSSLRETKRAETARCLATTAHTLVRQRGFDEVTVDDIVEMAHVSRRTFSNYYSCKEEAVAAVILLQAASGLAAWQPSGSPSGLLALVRDLVRHQGASGTLATLADVVSLTAGHRQLVPFVREAQWRLWSMAEERVLDELRGPTDADVRAELNALLGAVFGVVSSRFSSVTGGEGDPLDVPRLLDHVLDRLETGFGPSGRR